MRRHPTALAGTARQPDLHSTAPQTVDSADRERLAALLAGVAPHVPVPVEPRADRRHEPFDLTDLQRAYTLGRRASLELGGVPGDLHLEFHSPALQPDRLRAALDKLVNRHDMLHAVLTADGRQQVLPTAPSGLLTVVDLRDADAAVRAAARTESRAELRSAAAAGEPRPALSAQLTLLSSLESRLDVVADLLFLDVASVLQLLGEWRRHYDNPEWTPEPVPLSFRDWAAAAEQLRSGPVGDEAATYWRDRLDDLPGAPDLPLAVTPGELGPPIFVHRRTELARGRWSSLRAAAEQHGITPAAAVLAAYAEVVRSWSRHQNITLTVAPPGRDRLHLHVDDVLGPFTAPMLLAVTSGPESSFAERAAHLQSQLADDLEHTAFSGIQVLRELTRLRGEGRAVAMPVVFSGTLGSAHDADDGLAAFGSLADSAVRTPQVWLENQVCERDGGLVITWNTPDGLLAAGVLDAMFDAYTGLLDQLATDESTWTRTGGVVSLPPEQADEQQQANDTAAGIPAARLHDLVARAAQRTPHAVAVIDAAGNETTYRQLHEQAYRIARRLRDCCDPQPNSLVAVSLRPGPELIAALLGVLHTGAAYVAIDPELPLQRRHALLRRCQVPAVITHEDLREQTTLPGVHLVTPDDEATLACSPDPLDSRQGVDDLAYVIFTSGSTGEPKGVMIRHRSAANTVQDINERFQVGSRDRVLALAPAGFDLSVYDVFGVLGAGGAVVVPAPSRAADVVHWTELVARYCVTVWNTVPAPMRLWVDDLDARGVPEQCELRLVLMSGDWIPVDLPRRIRRHLPDAEVISLGGATEGSIWSVHYPIGEVPADWPSIPYGKALANQTMHVHNTWLESCPTWVTGEIHIGGVGVADGYWQDQVRTDERFIRHPVTGQRLYRTGDLGRYLPGGDIQILGREDHQVKINGYRVELGEIEDALGRQPGVRQALATAPVHPQTKQRHLVAHLLLDDGADPAVVADPAVLREAVAEMLPAYMVPGHYLLLDRLPLTGNGKVDRGALAPPWDGEDAGRDRVAPGDEIEQRLHASWVRQLGHDDLGVTDGFFDAGGDSLHAVGILRDIRETFGLGEEAEQDLIESLFMNADISGLAKVIASLQKADA